MTEAEFVAWADEDTRAEWVDGEVVFMAPESGEHDYLGWWLHTLIQLFVEHHDLGRVHGSNFTARFADLARRRLPDVMYVAKGRLNLLHPNHFEGAPDLIIELVSPNSQSRDWREKFAEYQKVGVREYWIVDSNSKHVEAYSLGRSGKYRQIQEKDGVIRSKVIRGFWIRTSWLWTDTRPSVLKALRELGIRS
jgi:Uma2 family endonuclease